MTELEPTQPDEPVAEAEADTKLPTIAEVCQACKDDIEPEILQGFIDEGLDDDEFFMAVCSYIFCVLEIDPEENFKSKEQLE